MLGKLNTLINPPPIDEKEKAKCCQDDWLRDSSRCKGYGVGVRYDAFLEAWFELADFWVEVRRSPGSYVSARLLTLGDLQLLRSLPTPDPCPSQVLDGKRYVDFIRMCYNGITTNSEHESGVRVWKDDSDIFYNSGFFGTDKPDDDFYTGHEKGEGSSPCSIVASSYRIFSF